MKRSLESIIYIVGFIVILLLPVAIYPVITGRLDHNNYENRSLMTWDKVCSESSWRSLFPNVEKYIEDNIPYKNECVGLIDKVDEDVFHDLYNGSVMVGKDDWLFYKKDGCIQDYRGGYVMTQDELKEYADAAVRFKAALEAQGIDLYLMITPNKESIYGDRYLPDKVIRISDKSRADQVVEYLKANTDCNVVWAKDALMDASYEEQVWRKYDTHWNEIGAFVGVQELLGVVRADEVALSDGMTKADDEIIQTDGNGKIDETGESGETGTTALSRVTIDRDGCVGGDLANMLGKGAVYADDFSYQIEGYKDDINVEMTETVQQSNLNFSKYESDSPDSRTVLFIGDSFLAGMEPYLSKDFGTTMFVHRSNYELLDRDLMDTEKPDIVVFQTAERFIDSYGYFMEMYAERVGE